MYSSSSSSSHLKNVDANKIWFCSFTLASGLIKTPKTLDKQKHYYKFLIYNHGSLFIGNSHHIEAMNALFYGSGTFELHPVQHVSTHAKHVVDAYASSGAVNDMPNVHQQIEIAGTIGQNVHKTEPENMSTYPSIIESDVKS